MPSCYPIHWYLSTRVWTKSKGRLSLYIFVRICTKNVPCQLKALIPPIVQGNPSPLILGIPFPILLRGPIPASLWVPIPLLVCFSFLFVASTAAPVLLPLLVSAQALSRKLAQPALQMCSVLEPTLVQSAPQHGPETLQDQIFIDLGLTFDRFGICIHKSTYKHKHQYSGDDTLVLIPWC